MTSSPTFAHTAWRSSDPQYEIFRDTVGKFLPKYASWEGDLPEPPTTEEEFLDPESSDFYSNGHPRFTYQCDEDDYFKELESKGWIHPESEPLMSRDEVFDLMRTGLVDRVRDEEFKYIPSTEDEYIAMVRENRRTFAASRTYAQVATDDVFRFFSEDGETVGRDGVNLALRATALIAAGMASDECLITRDDVPMATLPIERYGGVSGQPLKATASELDYGKVFTNEYVRVTLPGPLSKGLALWKDKEGPIQVCSGNGNPLWGLALNDLDQSEIFAAQVVNSIRGDVPRDCVLSSSSNIDLLFYEAEGFQNGYYEGILRTYPGDDHRALLMVELPAWDDFIRTVFFTVVGETKVKVYKPMAEPYLTPTDPPWKGKGEADSSAGLTDTDAYSTQSA